MQERKAGSKMSELKRLIEKAERMVFFGGAGVSTESGIPDFRSVDGLYSQKFDYPPEEILSHSFFMSHTQEFYSFYKEKMLCFAAKPNAAHLALAKLERDGKLAAVVTQNIDGLHQDAGSRNVLELHGSVRRNYCMNCHKSYDAHYIADCEGVPRCTCGGLIKPDVVLYEEQLDEDTLERAVKYISEADLLIVGGTSLNVYPAAGLLRYFGKSNLVLINKTATPFDSAASLVLHESIGKAFSELMK